LKSDHKTWAGWLAIRQRNQLDVAQITDWQTGDRESRCRADLTKANPAAKCKQWIREFVWLANKHLVILDVVETAKPEIRRQWQLHAGAAPEFGDRVFTVVNRPPPRVTWADATLKPKNDEGRLFCQTLLPREYHIVLHSGGKAESLDARGQSLGAAEGNAYHLKFGKHVVQIEPLGASAQSIFLHVLTATDAGNATPPKAAWRLSKTGVIEVSVEGATTTLSVPESGP
jgi:hypothetical protein